MSNPAAQTIWLPGEGEHTAHMGAYFGLWAIEPSHMNAALDYLRGANIAEHVAQVRLVGGAQSAHRVTHVRMSGSRLDRLRERRGEQAAERAGAHKSTSRPAGEELMIAVIEIRGTLMKRASSLEEATSTIAVRREVRAAAADDSIDAIMLVIDSPGGTVAGTEDLGAEIRAASERKPVWTHVQDCMCSGALWLGMQTSRITANARTANIGSIGAMIALYDRAKEAEQRGIEAVVITTGENKGLGFPGREVSESDREMLQGWVNHTGAVFRDAIAHRVDGETLDRLMASAEVIDADEAVELGVIDGIEPFETAIAAMFAHLEQQGGNTMSGAQKATFDGGNIKLDASAGGAQNTPESPESPETPQTPETPDDGGETPEAPEQPGGGEGDQSDEAQASMPATAGWLEQQFPHSTADFRYQCLKDGLTRWQSACRYVDLMQAQSQAEREKREAAEKRLHAAGIAGEMSGGEAVDVGSADEQTSKPKRTDPYAERLGDVIRVSGSPTTN